MGHSLSDLQYDVQNPNVQPDTGCLSLIFTQLQNTTGCHRQFTGYLLRFAAFPRLPTVLLPDPVNLIVHLVISEPNRYPNFLFQSELRVIVIQQNQTRHLSSFCYYLFKPRSFHNTFFLSNSCKFPFSKCTKKCSLLK